MTKTREDLAYSHQEHEMKLGLPGPALHKLDNRRTHSAPGPPLLLRNTSRHHDTESVGRGATGLRRPAGSTRLEDDPCCSGKACRYVILPGPGLFTLKSDLPPVSFSLCLEAGDQLFLAQGDFLGPPALHPTSCPFTKRSPNGLDQ